MPPALTLSLITTSSAFPGSATAAVEDSKRRKHVTLASGHYFVQFSVETSDIIGPSAVGLINKIDRRIAKLEDLHATYFFRKIHLQSSIATALVCLELSKEANSHELECEWLFKDI